MAAQTALHATHAAVEEGGGVVLLRAKQAVAKLKDENPEIPAGINIVLKALEAPTGRRGLDRGWATTSRRPSPSMLRRKIMKTCSRPAWSNGEGCPRRTPGRCIGGLASLSRQKP
jgi:hypothetical protein